MFSDKRAIMDLKVKSFGGALAIFYRLGCVE